MKSILYNPDQSDVAIQTVDRDLNNNTICGNHVGNKTPNREVLRYRIQGLRTLNCITSVCAGFIVGKKMKKGKETC